MAFFKSVSLLFAGLPKDAMHPWCREGASYSFTFSVEYVGARHKDVPRYTLVSACAAVRNVVDSNDLSEMMDEQELPIASGVYHVVVKYWYRDFTDEDGCPDCDYGFDVTKLTFLGTDPRNLVNICNPLPTP